MIKDIKEYDFNNEEYTVGSKEEQELYQNELGNIETNLSETWGDLGKVKQNLWQKLNKVKTGLREKLHKHMNNLAQINPINHILKKKEVSIPSELPA